jgi:hypothetical protein
MDFAQEVWERSARSQEKTLTALTSFFGLTTHLAVEWSRWGWDRLGYVSSHLGEIEGMWIDREEPLATAIVRRAFNQGTWDTSLLCSTLALQDGWFIQKPHDLQVECWVWKAEHVEYSQFGNENYYQNWCNAFEVLNEETDLRLTHNIIVALLAGRLFNKITECEPPSIKELLDKLENIHTKGSQPHKARAALEMIRYVSQGQKPGHLTAADRLAISKSIKVLEIITEVGSVTDGPPSEASEPSGATINPILLDQAEMHLESLLGKVTWERLSRKAKDHFKHGEFFYTIASIIEGEGGDFGSFVRSFSHGLLAEIQDSIKGPLAKDRSLKAEFWKLLGGTKHPEWGEILRFLADLEKNDGSKLVTRLIAQGVKLNQLSSLKKHFETMRSCRNKAAHTWDRIDREEAAVLHNLLINGGLIKKVVECFPKARLR